MLSCNAEFLIKAMLNNCNVTWHTNKVAGILTGFDCEYFLGGYARSAPTPTTNTRFGDYWLVTPYWEPSDVGLLISANGILGFCCAPLKPVVLKAAATTVNTINLRPADGANVSNVATNFISKRGR